MELIEKFLVLLWQLINQMAYPLIFGYLIAGILNQFFSVDLLVKLLAGNKIWQSVKAALFGIPLPLCSCSVLPLAETLRQKGAGKGAITSFVISTPQTGIDSIIVTYGALGLPFALFKALAAFFSGVIGGFFVDFFYSNKNTEPTDENKKVSENCCLCKEDAKYNLKSSLFAKIAGALKYTFFTLPTETALYLLIGFVVGAILNLFIPENFFEKFIGNQILEIIAVLIFSIPIYVCASASVPVALVLLMKGLSPGAVFVFLMCGPASNTVSLIFMQKILGLKGLFIYLISLISTALVFSLIINYLFMELKVYSVAECHTMNENNFFGNIPAIILILMIFVGLFNICFKKYFPDKEAIGS